jgi:hypothetical protein
MSARWICLWMLLFAVSAPAPLVAADKVASSAAAETPAHRTDGGTWFREKRAVNLGAVMLFSAAFFWLMVRSRRGKTAYIRPIAGLEALGDAVGRAAEMGRPIAYIPGLSDVSDPATAASLSILSQVAYRAARLKCGVNVPNFSPLTFPVSRIVVKDAFVRAGRGEDFNPDDIVYLTSRHMTYTTAVVGMLTRKKIAANFLIGHFYSESLILAETGASVGARQIGGCDSVSQLPFFITTCDYTLIGEELFAAGALLSGDPVNRSTIVANDWLKAGAGALLLIGLALMLLDALGVDGAAAWAERIAHFIAEGR